MLHKAYFLEQTDTDDFTDFSLPSRLSNLKAFIFYLIFFKIINILRIKAITTDITDVGARVFDFLGKEEDLRRHREKAT